MSKLDKDMANQKPLSSLVATLASKESLCVTGGREGTFRFGRDVWAQNMERMDSPTGKFKHKLNSVFRHRIRNGRAWKETTQINEYASSRNSESSKSNSIQVAKNKSPVSLILGVFLVLEPVAASMQRMAEPAPPQSRMAIAVRYSHTLCRLTCCLPPSL